MTRKLVFTVIAVIVCVAVPLSAGEGRRGCSYCNIWQYNMATGLPDATCDAAAADPENPPAQMANCTAPVYYTYGEGYVYVRCEGSQCFSV
jgi:hypothetical protein